MKNKILILSLMLFLVCSPINIYATESGDTTDKVYITSGELYDELYPLCPGLTLYSNNNALNIDISNMEMPEDADQAALKFMDFAASALSSDYILDEYTAINFLSWNDFGLADLYVTDFENLGSFLVKEPTPGGDDEFINGISKYYNEIFGHFDMAYWNDVVTWAIESVTDEAESEQPQPEFKYCDMLVAYSSFFDSIDSYDVSDGVLTLTIQNDYEGTKENGYDFCDSIKRLVRNYARIYNSGKSLLSCNSIDVKCVSQDDIFLCRVNLSIDSEGEWQTSLLFGNSDDFMEGYLERNQE